MSNNMWTHYHAPKQVGRIGLGCHRRRIDVLLNHGVFLGRCQSTLNVKVYDLFDSVVPYEQAWQWQKKLVEKVASDAGGNVAGAVLLLQHPSTYTLGTGATEENLKFDPDSPPYPLYRIERGGEVTYHGPGQLVMYPILNLKKFETDLHWYLRTLEEIIIQAIEQVSGLEGHREEGLTGVWINGKKVAAIGVRASRWVSYHGLALNVTVDLKPFNDIVPCGISHRPVSSIAEILREEQALMDPFSTLELFYGGLDNESSWERNLLLEYRYGLLETAQDILGVDWDLLCGNDALDALKML